MVFGWCVVMAGCYLGGVWVSGECLGSVWEVSRGLPVLSGGCWVVSEWFFRHFFKYLVPPPRGIQVSRTPGQIGLSIRPSLLRKTLIYHCKLQFGIFVDRRKSYIEDDGWSGFHPDITILGAGSDSFNTENYGRHSGKRP